ncbi:uncharacterized protein BXZ73DRAFT_72912 [Epithele typhae]|uniref:uncharacterized protein n=1 Tax=Epithele typhae TaxID=378194 RepID=UPI0020078D46|nr:uncharacterized protein BXZ73DRAFT_72912 [Epithele typhae]KAH9946052.1 hypothetical protein BXZ73DRAFT_72912 [Epithele typhae]
MNTTTDAGSLEESQDFLIDYYTNTRIFNNVDLSVFVLILFEYLVTFDREVRFAWGKKISWARTIFLLNRYLSIFEYLFLLGPLLPLSTVSSCNVVTRTSEVLQIILYAVWAAFAGIRIHAISARTWWITILVTGLALVPTGTNIYAAYMTVSTVFPETGCMAGIDIDQTTWMHAMLSLNVVQIVVDFVEAGSYGLVIPFLNVITPIMISRFFLELDDLTRKDRHGTLSTISDFNKFDQDFTLKFVNSNVSSNSDDYKDIGGALDDFRSHSDVNIRSDSAQKTFSPAATW